MRGLLAMLVIAPALAGCGSWFGFSDDEEPVPGERISVFTLDERVVPVAGEGPFTLPDPVAAAVWEQQDGNSLNRPGHAAYSGALEVAWADRAVDGETSYSRILSQPVVGNGRIYLLDGETRVVALTLEDRRAAWTLDLLPDGESADASLGGGLALDGGTLFVTTPYGELAALDAADGTVLWSRSFGIPFRAAPTVRSSRVYANLVSDRLVAVRADDGSDLWVHEGPVKQGPSLLGAAAPAASDDVVIAPYSSGEIVALRADTGREAWRAPLARESVGGGAVDVEDITASPVIDGDTVVAASAGGALSAFETRSGVRLWSVPMSVEHTPRIAGDWVFALSARGEVMCISRSTGEARWVANLRILVGADIDDDILWTGIILAGGQVVAVGSDLAVALSAESGALLRATDIPGEPSSAPLAVSGLLYLLTREGSIVALR